MPWKEASPMDQRTQFIADHLRDVLSITELCTRSASSPSYVSRTMSQSGGDGASSAATVSRRALTASGMRRSRHVDRSAASE